MQAWPRYEENESKKKADGMPYSSDRTLRVQLQLKDHQHPHEFLFFITRIRTEQGSGTPIQVAYMISLAT